MSKNNKERPIPTPQLPPTAQPPEEITPPELPAPLVNLVPSVLEESKEGEAVIVRWQETPITVTTLAGVRLGNVMAQDTIDVRLRKSSHGSIISIDAETMRCFVEVP